VAERIGATPRHLQRKEPPATGHSPSLRISYPGLTIGKMSGP
jgi:hypothetical protein